MISDERYIKALDKFSKLEKRIEFMMSKHKFEMKVITCKMQPIKSGFNLKELNKHLYK